MLSSRFTILRHSWPLLIGGGTPLVLTPDTEAYRGSGRNDPAQITGCTEPRPAVLITIAAILFAVALIPFFLCYPLPLADYPNHLARSYIIASLPHSPVLQSYYEVHWHLVPNLALDLLVPRLAHVMPVNTAMLAFTALTLGMWVAGCFAVHRALFAKLSYAPLSVFLLLYNRQFLWGFLNYLFSLGLALLTFALWVRLRRKSVLTRCAVFMPLGFAIFISHLGGFGVFVLLISGYGFHALMQEKDYRALRNDVITAVLAVGLPLAIFLSVSPTHLRRTPPELWGLRSRLIGLADPFNNYVPALDAATLILVVATITLGLYTGRARVHHRMLLPIITLVIVYWTINSQFLGTQGAARRLIPALFLILACSLEWRVRPQSVAAVIIFVFLVRMGVVVKVWSAASYVYRANLDVMNHVPRGAKLAVAVAEINFPQLNIPPLLHLPGMAVLTGDVFTNALFAEYGVQPLQFRPDYSELLVAHEYDVDVLSRKTQSKEALTTIVNPFDCIPLTRFDYLLLVNKRYIRYPVPGVLKPVYSAADTVLYQVVQQRSHINGAR